MMSVLCDRAIVKKEGLWDVVGEDEWKINNLLDKKYEPRPAHEIIQEAESFLNQELPYCVFRSNCEHFVTDLRYGKAQSRQVRCAVNTLTKDLFSCSHNLYQGYSIRNPKGQLAKFPFSPGSGTVTVKIQKHNSNKNVQTTVCTKGYVVWPYLCER